MALLRVSDNVAKSVGVRLRRIEGQIKGLQRMLSEERDCAEIAQQIAAARSALDRVAIDLMTAGLEQCVRMELSNRTSGTRTLRRLQRTFLMLR